MTAATGDDVKICADGKFLINNDKCVEYCPHNYEISTETS